MTLSNLKPLATAIAGFAPTLATMLLGPLAGTAVSALEQVFGLQKGAGPDAITQIVQSGAMTPDQLVAVRVADQKHAEIIEQQKIDLAKINADHDAAFAAIDAQDRASARAREVALKDWMPKFIACLVVIAVIGAEGSLLYFGQPKGIDGVVLGRILGTLDSALIMVLSYYFGSSAGSSKKDQILGEIAKS